MPAVMAWSGGVADPALLSIRTEASSDPSGEAARSWRDGGGEAGARRRRLSVAVRRCWRGVGGAPQIRASRPDLEVAAIGDGGGVAAVVAALAAALQAVSAGSERGAIGDTAVVW